MSGQSNELWDFSKPIDSSQVLLRGEDSVDSTRGNAEGEKSVPGAASPLPKARTFRIGAIVTVVVLIVAVISFFAARRYVRSIMVDNLPKTDGTSILFGLQAPVTVQRDEHGVPHLSASSIDDLVYAQGFIVAEDRLWQMDLLRRHAAGSLAEIFGRSMLEHDRLQRTLQLRAAADRAMSVLPADQKHWLELYARGVNAAIAQQHAHLPVEFRLLGYSPAPWTPRDSVLVELSLYEDLTNTFVQKLGRESLGAHLSPELMADLYPVGSWRDHYPGQPVVDVSAPQPDFKEVPLDESQSKLRAPALPAITSDELTSIQRNLAPFNPPCMFCLAGSNVWAVAGSRTASGKPMLSNDMHLTLTVPEIWYEIDLKAANPAPLAAFHAAGVTIPGAPFVIAGHNDHVAWGFANLGADVQDVFIEHTRGTPSGAEYKGVDGAWHAIRYQPEIIRVRGSADVRLDVPLTQHGNMSTPVISSITAGETRTLSLQWTIYDPANLSGPLFGVDFAADGSSLLNAFSSWGGPPLSMVYADDQGHIGFHAIGKVPVRGDINNPGALSPVPTDTAAPDAISHEWAGYIPFEQLPQVLDPADGVLVAANAKVTPDGYRYPITLNWMAPYRTERIYRLLEGTKQGTPQAHPFTPADMLRVQNDVNSELDQVLAQRIAYAIDHADGAFKNDKRLHQAADILRNWNGRVEANAAAPAIINATRLSFWPMLLIPKLVPQMAPELAKGVDLSKVKGVSPDTARVGSLWRSYVWGERDAVEEKLITTTPARWLPPGFSNWNDFLAAVTLRALTDSHAPSDLSTWTQGKAFPLDIKHPIFAQSKLLQLVAGVQTGTGPQAESGDMTTVKQVGSSFGPSQRFTSDLSDPDTTTSNLVLGEAGNPVSPWYMDQLHAWLAGETFQLPFSASATNLAAKHALVLNPR